MKLHELERMHPARRRRFLKWLGTAVAGATVTPEFRFACFEVAGGKAQAQADAANQPTYFIELNLRDQWDNGHVMVGPSLASRVDLQRGESGQAAALFFSQAELQYSAPHRAYLTNESKALAPHLDHVALLDAFEPSTGMIHGHEAANPIRSPGRAYDSTGRSPMWNNDPVSTTNLQGCEPFYARTPTPASLHNHLQKAMTPGLRSGIAFKGISRSIHTAYHFGAGLEGAELDRVPSKDELFKKFPSVVENVNIVSSSEEAEAFRRILEKVDRRRLKALRYSDAAVTGHVGTLGAAREILHVREPRVVSLPLTEEETAYWSAGVPGQKCTRNDTEVVECTGEVKAQIWEQMAYAYKLLTSGLTRTVALEFDFMDLHGYRPELSLRTMAAQLSIPLARLIDQLKATPLPSGAGTMFDRTLVAAFTTDGSRSPAAESYGDTPNAKNSLLLAGGMIRGGYYGDLSGNAGSFAVHAPDDAGNPLGAGTRLSSARGWRTVMAALGTPASAMASFPDVAGAAPLGFVLR